MLLVKPSFEIMTEIGMESLKLIERAGRTCYLSEDKITDDSAIAFCKKIIKRGHLSVIEHALATVKLIVDRGFLAEITRHRLCSFSVESTRYISYKSGVTFIIPPWFEFDTGERKEYIPGCQFTPLAKRRWHNHLLDCEDLYQLLLKEGQSPQQARSVLPNSLKTEIVMTANFREWRHIFSLRCSEAAHPQMREIMLPLQEEFRRRVPVVFDSDT